MNPLIQLKATPLFLVVLACFGLSPMAQALLPPPAPDGGYPGFNTAEGDGALFNLGPGTSNTAIGNSALFTNTFGSYNTATGDIALYYNEFGLNNTATGAAALTSNNSSNNTAMGAFALRGNTSGHNNTATGVRALFNNITGAYDTATGAQALESNTTGFNNTAIGRGALFSNTIGATNTATGARALLNNTTGGNNIALGFNAGVNLTNGNNNIEIGNAGVAGEAGTIRIGAQGTQTRTFVAGILGSFPTTGPSVVVNSFGRLGLVASSQRFKDDIKPMDKASEAILALKPVTFHYKKAVDPDGIPQFGLVAEQVEKVNPDLIARDADGKPYTVRYEAVNAMLLNEFLKEHRKVEQLTKDFESKLAEQQKQIERLTAGLQKVTAQLEVTKPAPRTVLNNQ
jgi:hypothetical protein